MNYDFITLRSLDGDFFLIQTIGVLMLSPNFSRKKMTILDLYFKSCKVYFIGFIRRCVYLYALVNNSLVVCRYSAHHIAPNNGRIVYVLLIF